MGMSASISLSLLSLGPERKVKCYNEYFVNGYVFHIEEYGHGIKTYNSSVCVKESTCSEFEVDYYGKLEEVVELQYHSEHNRVFLFKCYWYDTTDRGIRVDHHYDILPRVAKYLLHMSQSPMSLQIETVRQYFTESCKIFITHATIIDVTTNRYSPSVFDRGWDR